jgi:hypothetical protein
MNQVNSATASQQSFQLWFASLNGGRPALCFPCDAGGTVALEELSERGRCNYLYARAVVGHEFAWPIVQEAGSQQHA